jgi:hypothetical protein
VQPDRHNKIRHQSLSLKKHYVPKSPKGAAGQVQQVRQSTLRAKVAHGCSGISTGVRKRPTGHITIQVTITYTRRGHHILHRLNLRDDTHLPIIEQHYPQFLTLKKISQAPLTYARPNRRGQQFSFTNPVYSKTATLHPHTMVPTTSRNLTHTVFRHHPSPPILSTPTRKISRLANLHTRQRLQCGHI